VRIGKEPWVLGISASHNGAVCLINGDRIVAAIQEERLTRVKRQRIHAATPALAIAYCLNAAGIDAGDLDMVVVAVQGRGGGRDNDVHRNRLLRTRETGVRVAYLPHHLAHAVSAFALSGFEDSAVLVIDGMGSAAADLTAPERAAVVGAVEDGFETASLYDARGTAIEPLQKHLIANGDWLTIGTQGMPRFGSLGGLYAAAAKQIFDDATEAGKVMALAALGEPRFPIGDFFNIDDGGFTFSDRVAAAFPSNDRWPRERDRNQDLAASAQRAIEAGVLHLARELRRKSRSRRLCYAGGVALNGIANERLWRESGFDDIFIVPAAEDGGCALGAAYWGLWQLTGTNTHVRLGTDALGRTYSGGEIRAAAAMAGVRIVAEGAALDAAVDHICDGRILGWFHGGAELGPRALGQRSIVCDPRRADMPAQLNGRIKRREAFRPFAPAILRDHVSDWFDIGTASVDSPFMLRVCRFKDDKRAVVPAVVHADGTGRLQTLIAAANGPFQELVVRFHRRTGVPLVLNTSFNGPGEPIVETPADALRCMLANGLDGCVFPDFIALPG